MSSGARLQKLGVDLDDAMTALGNASSLGEFTDAETRAAMALTSMRPELVATAEGRQRYAQRRDALTKAAATQRVLLKGDVRSEGVR